jgi:hypothetical protein
MSEAFLGVDWMIDPDTHDWVLDGVGEPRSVAGRACLAQDLRHRLAFNVDVLGFLNRDLRPGQVDDLLNLVALEAEKDPRVTARSAEAALRAFDVAQGLLEISLSVLPIGSDRPENLVVRVGAS